MTGPMTGLILTLRKTEKEAHAAGADCAEHGANETNCHFSFFATPALMQAWERGKRERLEEMKNGTDASHTD